MKNSTSQMLLTALPGACLAALVTLAVPSTRAQYADSSTSDTAVGATVIPSQQPVYPAQATQDFPAQQPIYFNGAQPGIPNWGPNYVETIGTRQAMSNMTVGVAYTTTSQPGTAWTGISAALTAMAAQGAPSSVLAADSVAPAIRSAPAMDPHQFHLLQMRIQASVASIDTLQGRAVVFSGDTQAELRGAVQEADARRVRLENSLANAQVAAPGQWSQARANLAHDYAAYARAAARVQRLASS